MKWEELAKPFPAKDIEWRIAQKGKTGNNQPWAKVLAYVTNRAIMQRLDDVCGPANWKNEFTHIDKAFLCGLSIRCGDEWVTKWDGAQESQIEATKGGISGAMKRAAVQWGIGRYLYDLEEGWAVISANGANYVGADSQKGIPAFKWDPPQLPEWALPDGETQKPTAKKEHPQVKYVDASELAAMSTLAKEVEADIPKLCEYFKIESLEHAPAEMYPQIMKALMKKKGK